MLGLTSIEVVLGFQLFFFDFELFRANTLLQRFTGLTLEPREIGSNLAALDLDVYLFHFVTSSLSSTNLIALALLPNSFLSFQFQSAIVMLLHRHAETFLFQLLLVVEGNVAILHLAACLLRPAAIRAVVFLVLLPNTVFFLVANPVLLVVLVDQNNRVFLEGVASAHAVQLFVFNNNANSLQSLQQQLFVFVGDLHLAFYDMAHLITPELFRVSCRVPT
ncbi:hypothetical protein H9J87_000776 [Escherichia coli]|nr:hypothetical protein [Escherichia coli]EGC4094362.1 hypothetical protein [Escherichia coli]HBW1702759.1 hypothetical protein [Klebsiella pneumoniae]